jgi:hypothetical protein
MCDYSLHLVTTRPAKVADKLISTKFNISTTRGFAEVGEPNVAVCVRPGTEIAFEKDVECYNSECYDALAVSQRHTTGQKIARFRQVNQDNPRAHHDALEFPDGQIVLLTLLCEGQRATVLQLPADLPATTMADDTKRESIAEYSNG